MVQFHPIVLALYLLHSSRMNISKPGRIDEDHSIVIYHFFLFTLVIFSPTSVVMRNFLVYGPIKDQVL